MRSGRLVDPQLTRMYQGVLAMSGANQENVFPRITELLGDRVITGATALDFAAMITP